VKTVVILAILATFALIFLHYTRSKDLKRLLVSFGSFVAIISLGIMGNITRPIIPLFLLHIVLITFAWGGLLYYLIRGRYVWWAIFSPVVTIVLFVALSLLEGSRYEDVWSSLF